MRVGKLTPSSSPSLLPTMTLLFLATSGAPDASSLIGLEERSKVDTVSTRHIHGASHVVELTRSTGSPSARLR